MTVAASPPYEYPADGKKPSMTRLATCPGSGPSPSCRSARIPRPAGCGCHPCGGISGSARRLGRWCRRCLPAATAVRGQRVVAGAHGGSPVGQGASQARPGLRRAGPRCRCAGWAVSGAGTSASGWWLVRPGAIFRRPGRCPGRCIRGPSRCTGCPRHRGSC
jgi:hypothetical protein